MYENHLKIPKSWFAGRDILEFGPNAGNNALSFAQWGSKLELVEPLQYLHKNIECLFTKHGCSSNLIKIHQETLESFEIDRKFDLVVAEGFLHALPNRKEAILKLFSYSKEFVVFTYSDGNGFFFEAFKRYLFRRVLEINESLDENFEEIVRHAEPIFGPAFSELGTARTFESWVQDILLNPCGVANTLDEFLTIQSLIPNKFYYYSGSPAWDLSHHFTWYKNVNHVKSLKEDYYNALPFIISGNLGENINPDDFETVFELTKYMMDYSAGLSTGSHFPCFNFNWKLLSNVYEIVHLLSDNKSEQAIELYLNTEVSQRWGMPHHYVCCKTLE